MAASIGTLKNEISRTRTYLLEVSGATGCSLAELTFNKIYNSPIQFLVSSVLNKNVKQFGKQHLFDGDEETCWNSDQGTLQWVLVEFNEEVCISEIHIQFQGGFVGKVCSLEKSNSGSSNFIRIFNFCPSDSSQKQVFKLPELSSLSTLKILFEQSTDLFGRITVYNLDIIGKIL